MFRKYFKTESDIAIGNQLNSLKLNYTIPLGVFAHKLGNQVRGQLASIEK